MPLLLVFGTTASRIPQAWKHRLNVVLAVVVMLFGLAFIDRAALLLGSPVTFESASMAIADTAYERTSGFKTGPDGVVEVPFQILNDKYVPRTVVIPAGRPVRLLVKRQEGDCKHGGMCAEALVIGRLGINATLTPRRCDGRRAPRDPSRRLHDVEPVRHDHRTPRRQVEARDHSHASLEVRKRPDG